MPRKDKQAAAEYGKAYRAANANRIKTQIKTWREANREKSLAQRKEYREANQDKVRAQRKEHYAANREKLLARLKEYREANRENIATQKREYCAANLDKVRAQRKASYVTNADKIRAHKREYYAANANQKRTQKREYNKTVPGMITNWWNNMNSRTVNGSHPRLFDPRCAGYIKRGIRIENTREELEQFVYDNELVIRDLQAVGEIPSIDRKDSSGHYSLDNIRIIALKENCKIGGINGGKITQAKKTASSKPIKNSGI